MVKRLQLKAAMLLAVLWGGDATASLHVFACEPEWAALARELGGEDIDTYSATTAQQDPHQIQARPSLIAKARGADLMICSGADLETGWLPQVQRQSANPKVQTNGAGYFEAANVVQRLEVPTVLDRAEGDVHPGGNPHVQTNPHNIAAIATKLSARMSELDPSRAAAYAQRLADFQQRWTTATTKWEAAAAPLKGFGVVVHHKYWAYLIDWLQLHEVATLEPKPGVPATLVHLDQVLSVVAQNPAHAILRTPYDDPQPSQWLSEKAHLPALVLPGSVGGLPGTDDLFGTFDVTIAELLKALP